MSIKDLCTPEELQKGKNFINGLEANSMKNKLELLITDMGLMKQMIDDQTRQINMIDIVYIFHLIYDALIIINDELKSKKE